MNYSVSTLTTVADCDTVLALIEKEKKDLSFKKLSLERQQENYANTTVEVTSEIEVLTVELSAINTVIATLPDGDTKDDNIKRQKKLEYNLFLLSNRKANYGAIALLEKEFSIARVIKELEEADTFAETVLDRKLSM
ncbi:hypothetical protein [Pedobacter endophyticus]|uniref:Uncharacterized protein n=1 Tax=Pedobacter endophyticus TaxID=2789740 RepID=A0A7S9PZT6_9SPHI|nr:hypothetical protein [Pedobacter endophyticus]QPH40893.1 hypothetical protein IZT61_06405 [Pedobacter endophyticus]